MAQRDRSGSESPATLGRGASPFILRHDFGFQVKVPVTWEVEYTPKATMKAGQVIYITPRGNIFFATFGELAELKEYRSLDEYAASAISRLPGLGQVTAKLVSVDEQKICGHRAILSNLQVRTEAGELVEAWMADLWCPVEDRYYSVCGELSQRQEFPYFPRVFTSTAESLVCHRPQADLPHPGWEFADVGFSPRSKLWFVELFDGSGPLEVYQSRGITLRRGTGIQYQWPQGGPKRMWHVRERVFLGDVDNIGYDDSGLVVGRTKASGRVEEIPQDFQSITYAFSLSSAKGFVEFRDSDDAVVKKIDDRWIAVEGLTHTTVGVYPNIRLKAKQEDIGKIIVTETCIIIQGRNPAQEPGQ